MHCVSFYKVKGRIATVLQRIMLSVQNKTQIATGLVSLNLKLKSLKFIKFVTRQIHKLNT